MKLKALQRKKTPKDKGIHIKNTTSKILKKYPLSIQQIANDVDHDKYLNSIKEFL